jgi:hypothetical protein
MSSCIPQEEVTKLFSFPPLTIDMCENGDETEGSWEKDEITCSCQ